MSNYIELKINTTDSHQKEIMLAQLSSAGAAGFEEDRNLLKAFFSADEFEEVEIAELINQFGLPWSKSVIEETNWNAIWEADFQPVAIDDFCSIRAEFHAPVAGVEHDIVITPKMSFGTGHHATTWMMVKAMSGLDFTGKRVFDFGTGTGILSILAEKCGAASVVAIDNDEWSIRNAVENFNVNNCHKILISNSNDFISMDLYDFILANINRNVILDRLMQIKQHLSANGVVVLSGLLSDDEPVIVNEAKRHHLKLHQRLENSGWICLLMVNS